MITCHIWYKLENSALQTAISAFKSIQCSCSAYAWFSQTTFTRILYAFETSLVSWDSIWNVCMTMCVKIFTETSFKKKSPISPFLFANSIFLLQSQILNNTFKLPLLLSLFHTLYSFNLVHSITQLMMMLLKLTSFS